MSRTSHANSELECIAKETEQVYNQEDRAITKLSPRCLCTLSKTGSVKYQYKQSTTVNCPYKTPKQVNEQGTEETGSDAMHYSVMQYITQIRNR